MKAPSVLQDKLLLRSLVRGDAEACGVLFDKYSAKIFRFILFKVSSRETAEDLASQCFLKMWEKIRDGAEIKNFQAWLYRVARNLVIDYYRQREKEELPLIYQLEEEEFSTLQVDPDKAIAAQDLQKLLLLLNGDVREIVVLKYIEGMSVKEIASIVEKSAVNVRVILHRAMKELKNHVQEKLK
jgi:RNA polymerase sigma-70 factor (ECF subfamily)